MGEVSFYTMLVHLDEYSVLQTSNLDGETNLKIRKALEKTWDYLTPEKASEFKGSSLSLESLVIVLKIILLLKLFFFLPRCQIIMISSLHVIFHG